MLLQADQLTTKWQLFSLKMTKSTILSEIDVILCVCSACNNVYSLNIYFVGLEAAYERGLFPNPEWWEMRLEAEVIIKAET